MNLSHSMRNRVKRKLLEMGAGALVLMGTLAIINPRTEIGLLQLIVTVLFFSIPALYLLREAAKYYGQEVDGLEVLMMMVSGAGIFLFLSVSVLSVDPLVIASSFVLFAVPAIVIYIMNKRRNVESIQPIG